MLGNAIKLLLFYKCIKFLECLAGRFLNEQ